MNRLRAICCAGLLLLPAVLHAQFYTDARSRDYGLATTDYDVRSIWTNPAGLGAFPEASVMLDAVLDHSTTDDWRVSQISAGFNSRGLAAVYQRDRFPNDSSGHTWRFGLAWPFSGGALGTALTLYRGMGPSQQDVDIGLRYRLARPLDLGLVLRHIGRPVVRNVPLPLTGVAALTWRPAGPLFEISGQTALAERRSGDSGTDISHRARLVVAPLRAPVAGLLIVETEGDFGLTRVHFGISVGSMKRVLALGSSNDPSGDFAVDAVSVTGVASNPLATR